jgi:preprotein translocase subunit SecY
MILDSLKSIISIKDLRKKIIATLLLVLVYKFLSVIPIPGVNTTGLASIIDGQKGLSFFSALMGGGLSNFSVILMGLSPYINAVIIIQLLGVIIPRIGDMQKEGEQGQRKITKYTRWLTLPIAFLQSYGMIVLLNSLAGGTIIDVTNLSTVLTAMTIATAGTIFLMWLGEVMTEYGISNGISIIIMAGVLSTTPSTIM